MNHKARIAIVVGRHGRGTNMEAIADAVSSGEINADIVLVTSPNPNALAITKARERGLPYAVEHDLLTQLKEVHPDIVCLAGYMRLLPPELIAEFPHRILNIHPSLLPKFGGRGMYASKVQEAVLAAGETVTGCTIHFVDEDYDSGTIILQRTCPVLPDDTVETLAARVLDEEHLAYPAAINQVLASL
jgi:formyltetrahydrofolate-dependent phosphoribosylglycinamide formyltransferase